MEAIIQAMRYPLLLLLLPFFVHGQIDVSYSDSISFKTSVVVDEPTPVIYFISQGNIIDSSYKISLSEEDIRTKEALSYLLNQEHLILVEKNSKSSEYQIDRNQAAKQVILPLYCVWQQRSIDQELIIRYSKMVNNSYKDYLISFQFIDNEPIPIRPKDEDALTTLLSYLTEDGLANFISPHSSGLASSLEASFFRPYPEAGINLNAVLNKLKKMSPAEKRKWLLSANEFLDN